MVETCWGGSQDWISPRSILIEAVGLGFLAGTPSLKFSTPLEKV